MDSPSLEGFHTQLDCKLTYGNKKQTQLTLLYYIKFFVQNETGKTGTMKNIAKLAQLLNFILIMKVPERLQLR